MTFFSRFILDTVSPAVKMHGKATASRRSPRKVFRIGSFFTGIGGIELGLHAAGDETTDFRTSFMCEIDDAARAVLKDRFKGTKIYEDVTEFTNLPDRINLITAGFPCQDLSQAGSTKGLDGARSGIVLHLLGLLKKDPVENLLIENVPFMLKLDGGQAIASITSKLEKMGYKWAYRVVDCSAFGTPQRRRRVFLFASKKIDPRRVLFADNYEQPTLRKGNERYVGFYWTEGNTGIGVAHGLIPPLKGGSSFGIPSAPAIIYPEGRIFVPTIASAEKLQGFKSGWTRNECLTNRKSRWRLVGNSVNPLAARWIGSRLANPGEIGEIEGARIGATWPGAAYNVGKGRREALVGEYPMATKIPSLRSFLGNGVKPLSERAAMGILKRLELSSLRQRHEIIEALRKHLVWIRESAIEARSATQEHLVS